MYVGEATAKVHVCLLTTVTKITFHVPYMKEYSFFIDNLSLSPNEMWIYRFIQKGFNHKNGLQKKVKEQSLN